MIRNHIKDILLVGIGGALMVCCTAPAGAQSNNPASKLSKKQLAALWKDLSSTSYLKADDAFQQFVKARSSVVPFLTKRIRDVAVPKVDIKRLHELVRLLGDKRFAVRQKAVTELAKQGELSVVPLQKILEGKPTLEVKRRATILLKTAEIPVFNSERVRAMEGIQILEAIDTPASHRALTEIARDAMIPLIRYHAKRATARIAKQVQKP